MPKKLFYNQNDVDAVKKIADDQSVISITEGRVLVAFADGTAKVQLAGSATMVIAQTTKNTTVEPGDFVFLIRSIITSRWFVLTSAMIQNMTGVIGMAGGAISDAPTSGIITAPNTLVVIATDEALIAQWESSGVQNNVVYQVGIADDSAGAGEVLKIVAGSQYVFSAPVGTTKYFRVRSVDENWNTSGWKGYVSGTVVSADIVQAEIFSRRIPIIKDIFNSIRLRINGFLAIFTHANTADRIYTLPDNSGTIALSTDQPDLVQIEMFARRPQIVNNTTTGGGSGITQLTGEVTAGPGTGSQAATITSPITGKAFTGGTIDSTPIGSVSPSSGAFSGTLALWIAGVYGLFTHANTASRTWTFKDADGTVAFTTDQPDILQIEVFN